MTTTAVLKCVDGCTVNVLDEQAGRGFFAEAKTKKKRNKKGEEEEEEGGVREIIIGREMRYPQGLLLIASLMSLWDVLVGYWIWIQLCRLRGVGISAQQTTARFDMDFFFFLPFLPDPAACFP